MFHLVPDFNTDLLDSAIVKKLCGFNETRIYIILANTLNPIKKLEFFRSFKSDHTTSNYIPLLIT